MERQLPGFERHTERPMPSQFLLWRREAQGLYHFIGLQAAPRDDRFTVEVACSPHGFRFGSLETGRADAASVRVPHLSDPSFRIERWWEIVPEEPWEEMTARIRRGEFYPLEEEVHFSLSKIPLLVSDAMDQLLEYGLVYLDKK